MPIVRFSRFSLSSLRYAFGGRGDVVASMGSCPANTSSISAASSTDFVMGPGLSRDDAMAITPWRLTLPYVGFKPTTPHHAAGCRIEPAVSEPTAAIASSAATLAAAPPDEPPGQRSMFQGLRVGPKSDASVEEPCAKASILVFPRLIAPASVTRRTTVASYGGTKFLNTLLEAVVLTPFVQKLSLMEMGTPSKGRTSPLSIKKSAFWACSSACSSVKVTNACTFGSMAFILSRQALVSSREENFFSCSPLRASVIVSS